MKIVYTGNSPAVDVPALGRTFVNGEPQEVPANDAKTLLLSADWKESKTTTNSKEADGE